MIDLHTHSSMSDGSYTPEALVDLALETGLGALALTDHDSLAGLGRAAGRRTAGGIPVALEEVAAISGGGIVSRAHFARLLVQKGVVKRTDDAFARYIGKGRPFYEPRRTLDLPDAIRLVRRAGGIAVVAHPFSLGLAGAALRQYLAHARDAGVAAIEAWHQKAAGGGSRR